MKNLKSCLWGILLLLVIPQAQSQDTNYKHYSSWNTLILEGAISAKYYVSAEFNFRRTNFTTDWEQFIVRPSFHYISKEEVDLSIGYSYIKNYAYSSFSTRLDVLENNVWEQVILKNKFKKFNLAHRLRLEQRFKDRLVNNQGVYQIEGTKFNHRFRYRFIVNIPIFKEELKTKLQVTAYDEVLLNLDQGVRPKSLNQNWMFLGLKYRINDKVSIRSGYHDVYLKLNSDSFVTNHIWETTLTYKII
ncbi:DUF2490 domain-containing protein [Mangrovimonas futianensis]|uniref:DUF2490 domain-containing protein n=1 Tax=Mangrovimonas futianensis TaxID=2895523 RepID=UPI001E3E3037|nr:DUF2490 domain-containing protein [Mangrovimonas futianensis]MCF1421117.1 DUF2490 domain-containing protein [Mangrovimonas futianensis]